jgi:hypothetical protein
VLLGQEFLVLILVLILEEGEFLEVRELESVVLEFLESQALGSVAQALLG